MEIRIGIADSNRELLVHSGQDAAEVKQIVADALAGKAAVLDLTDEKGRQILVPISRLAYIELGTSEARTVGFAAT